MKDKPLYMDFAAGKLYFDSGMIGNKLHIGNSTDKTLSVIDITNDNVVETIKVDERGDIINYEGWSLNSVRDIYVTH